MVEVLDLTEFLYAERNVGLRQHERNGHQNMSAFNLDKDFSNLDVLSFLFPTLHVDDWLTSRLPIVDPILLQYYTSCTVAPP